jgi:putative iron-regulated protein
MRNVFFIFPLLAVLLGGCTKKKETTPTPTATDADIRSALVGYSTTLEGMYGASHMAAEQMKTSIETFLTSPTEANLLAAKNAWKAARDVYSKTEAARFYGGPIDGDEGPESLMNSWPLDEAVIDYVQGAVDTGSLIANTTRYPNLTLDVLVGLNQSGSETNVTTGWHAIEFLLWGQDLSLTGPGARPLSDFGRNAFAARRAQYLRTITDLLISNLEEVHRAWMIGAPYRTSFTTTVDAKTAAGYAFRGLGTLARAEAGGERMVTALTTQEQEEEQNCFSDYSVEDLRSNLEGIAQLYGNSANAPSSSLSGLVAKQSAEKNKAVQDAIIAARVALQTIAMPLDQAIIDPAGRTQVSNAIAAYRALADRIVDAAAVLSITINTEG